MKKSRIIIHDWDDVVVNSFEAYSQWYFDFARHFGLPEPTLAGLRAHWGKTVAGIVRGQWPDMTQEQAEAMIAAFATYQDESGASYRATVFDGVIDAFKQLSESHTLAVLSSGYRPAIEKMYRALIDPDISYHKAIAALPDLAAVKPDPRALDQVLAMLGEDDADLSRVAYIGDSLIDWETARDRGVQFYAVTTGVHSKDDFVRCGVDEACIFGRFSDIVPLFAE
jgi:phosphoglycolate phosphatase-like HAD superfamily hydrolase